MSFRLEYCVPIGQESSQFVIGKEFERSTVGFYVRLSIRDSVEEFESVALILHPLILISVAFAWSTCTNTSLTHSWIQHIPIPPESWEWETLRKTTFQMMDHTGRISVSSEPEDANIASFVKYAPAIRRWQKRELARFRPTAKVDLNVLDKLLQSRQYGALRLGDGELRHYPEGVGCFVFDHADLPPGLERYMSEGPVDGRCFQFSPELMSEFCGRILSDNLVKRLSPEFHFPNFPLRGEEVWQGVNLSLEMDDPFGVAIVPRMKSNRLKNARVRIPLDDLSDGFVRETRRYPAGAALAIVTRTRALLEEIQPYLERDQLGALEGVQTLLEGALSELTGEFDETLLTKAEQQSVDLSKQIEQLREQVIARRQQAELELRSSESFQASDAKLVAAEKELRIRQETLERELKAVSARTEQLRREIAAAGDDPELSREEALLRAGWERLEKVKKRLGNTS